MIKFRAPDQTVLQSAEGDQRGRVRGAVCAVQIVQDHQLMPVFRFGGTFIFSLVKLSV